MLLNSSFIRLRLRSSVIVAVAVVVGGCIGAPLVDGLESTSGALNFSRFQYPIDAKTYDIDFVHNFTRHLHYYNRFHSFVSFCTNREANRNRRVIVRSLEQALVEDFGVPIIVWGMADAGDRLSHSLGLNNLAFVSIAAVDDPVLAVVDATLEGLHFMSMLVIFKRLRNETPSADDIRRFFVWCWRRNIVNVALTFQVIRPPVGITPNMTVHNQVFTYSPFPTLHVHNLTEDIYTSRGNFIVDKISNVRGYRFTTPIFQDPPNVFLIPRARKPFIAGSAGRLFAEYVRHINGTINMVPARYNSFYAYHKQTLLLAANKEIDIGIHPFSALLEFANETAGSYPIAQTNACVIVPLVPEIPPGEYLVRPMHPSVRRSMLVVCAALFVLKLLAAGSKGRGWRGIRDNAADALLYVFGTVLSQPMDGRTFARQSAPGRLGHLAMLVFALTMRELFAASLMALLNVTVLGRQIDSVEDFLASGLRILVHEHEKQIYFDGGRLPAALRSRLLLTTEALLVQHRDSLNTSYAYVVTAEMWTKLNIQQFVLRKPRFRLVGGMLCTPNYFLKFPLQWDSPFAPSLAIFTMVVHESGIGRIWEYLSIVDAVRMGLIQVFHDEEAFRPLSLAYFTIPFAVFVVTTVLAIAAFVGELAWHRRQRARHPPCGEHSHNSE